MFFGIDSNNILLLLLVIIVILTCVISSYVNKCQILIETLHTLSLTPFK